MWSFHQSIMRRSILGRQNRKSRRRLTVTKKRERNDINDSVSIKKLNTNAAKDIKQAVQEKR